MFILFTVVVLSAVITLFAATLIGAVVTPRTLLTLFVVVHAVDLANPVPLVPSHQLYCVAYL